MSPSWFSGSCGYWCLPLLCTTIITAASINAIPSKSLIEKGSSNTTTPMTTAVVGSKAPSMAVGVDPIYRAAYTIITNAMIAGTMASHDTQSHALAVVGSING